MLDRLLAASFVVVAWWLSTALVLRLVWLRPRTHGASMAVASVLAVAGIWGVAQYAAVETALASYVGFASALAVWAWHEVGFLLGRVTGPRRTACPPSTSGWVRFRHATETLIHHELALAGTAGLLVALTWGAPNQVGTGTFLALWVMRLSAKLNLFLGVQHFTEELVPERLRYLTTYFGKASSNPLMPGSLVVAGGVAGSLLATSAGASRDVVVGHTLLATLLALAFIEHLFLALPMRDAVLFRWALGSDAERRGDLESAALAPDAHVGRAERGRAERHTERVDRAGPVDPTAAVGVPCTPHGWLVDGGVDGRGHDGR